MTSNNTCANRETDNGGRIWSCGRPKTLPLRSDFSRSAATEFFAYLAMMAGIFIAGAVTKASSGNGHHDFLTANSVWLLAVILTFGYMISRGIAESGSRQPYDER